MITIIIAVFKQLSMDKHAIIGNPMFMAEGEGVENTKLGMCLHVLMHGVVIEDNGEYDYWGNILYNGQPDVGFEEHGCKAENIASIAEISANFYGDEVKRLKDGVYNTVNPSELGLRGKKIFRLEEIREL